jgi:hypothetical protein
LNPIRLGAQFSQQVANAKDLFFVKKTVDTKKNVDTNVDRETMQEVAERQRNQIQSSVEDIVGGHVKCAFTNSQCR